MFSKLHKICHDIGTTYVMYNIEYILYCLYNINKNILLNKIINILIRVNKYKCMINILCKTISAVLFLALRIFYYVFTYISVS